MTAASKSETERDIGNVEAWAEIIAHMLWHVPPGKRGEVLALAVKDEEAAAQERKVNPFGLKTFQQITDEWPTSRDARHGSAIARLKSLLIQVFTRDIANSHSDQDAAAMLYGEHSHGTGSCLLRDYLPPLRKGETDVHRYD